MRDASAAAIEARGGTCAPSAFDALASTYDASFTTTALGRRLRALVWQRLDAALLGARRVLDVGCGTGEDAVRLASRGVEVVAIDPSPSMLRVAAEKAQAAGCSERITLHCLPLERMGELDTQPFDAVFSNFGAVNCVPNLARAIDALAPLVAPGAPLMWVVMGRNVPWEWLWFLARGRVRSAFRRRARDGVAWRGMQIAYPAPATLAQALETHFEDIVFRPLGIVLPPSYAAGWLENAPRTLAALTRLECAVHDRRWLAPLADHYIVEARCKTERPE